MVSSQGRLLTVQNERHNLELNTLLIWFVLPNGVHCTTPVLAVGGARQKGWPPVEAIEMRHNFSLVQIPYFLLLLEVLGMTHQIRILLCCCSATERIGIAPCAGITTNVDNLFPKHNKHNANASSLL